LKHKNIVIALLIVIGGGLGAVVLSNFHKTDVVAETQVIMTSIPLDCYVYFSYYGNGTTHQTNEQAQVVWYPPMVDSLNHTLPKNLGPFMRSPSFTVYLFNHCPFLNTTKPIIYYPKFNESLGVSNTFVHPSQYLLEKQKEQQELMNYDLFSDPKHYNRIEYLASAFNQTLPEITDELFLTGAVDMDKCTNPSWRQNSTIRECTWQNSHYVVDRHDQSLMVIVDRPPPVK
jgi:hypothetical protein